MREKKRRASHRTIPRWIDYQNSCTRRCPGQSGRADAHTRPGDDLACAEPLIENADPDALIGDKAYDSDPFVDTLTQRAITPVIPPKANRKTQRACEFTLYCERNLVERFFNKLKTFLAIANRYE